MQQRHSNFFKLKHHQSEHLKVWASFPQQPQPSEIILIVIIAKHSNKVTSSNNKIRYYYKNRSEAANLHILKTGTSKCSALLMKAPHPLLPSRAAQKVALADRRFTGNPLHSKVLGKQQATKTVL